MVKLVGLEGSRASVKMVEMGLHQWSWEPLAGVNIYVGLIEYVLGLVVSSAVLGFAAYGIVQGFWAVFGRKK